MSFWTPVENPGTRPPRSRVFDIGCSRQPGPYASHLAREAVFSKLDALTPFLTPFLPAPNADDFGH